MIWNEARFRFKRGREQDLRTLDSGEPAFTTDTKKFFIGTGSENIQIGGGGGGGVVSIPGLVTGDDFGVSPSTTRGNSASLQALINRVRADFIASGMTTQPVIHLEAGVYVLDAEVTMSPYLKFKTLGTVIFKITHNGTGIHITPNANDPQHGSWSDYHLFKNFWNRGKYFEGNFVFMSSLPFNHANTNTIALEIGPRTNTFTDANAVSRYTVEQINIYGVAIGIKLNTYQHYIGTIENCHIEMVKHNIVWGTPGQPVVNSGEKFIVKDCVIAGSSSGPIKLNNGSIDLTFINTSFDFNMGPIVSMTESGVGLRFTNCYIEEIDTNPQLVVYCKPQVSDSTYGRNTVVINGLQMLLRNWSKIIENAPYGNTNNRTAMTVSVSGLEVRHINATSGPVPMSKMFLVDTSEDITLTQKDMIINPLLHNCFLADNQDVSQNGDFTKTTQTALTNANDTYWSVSMSSNVTNAVANSGVNNSKAVNISITNTTAARWIDFTGKHKIPAKAGQSVVVMPSIKSTRIDSGFKVECRVQCYDAANALISTEITYADFTTSSNLAINEFSYPRYMPKSDLPKGTVSIVPQVVFTINQGSTALSFTVNNIFVAIVGD